MLKQFERLLYKCLLFCCFTVVVLVYFYNCYQHSIRLTEIADTVHDFVDIQQWKSDALLGINREDTTLNTDTDTDTMRELENEMNKIMSEELNPGTLDQDDHSWRLNDWEQDSMSLDNSQTLVSNGEDLKRCQNANAEAYVTLVHSQELVIAAEVLFYSLSVTLGTTRNLVVLVTPNIRPASRERLQQKGWIVQVVPEIGQQEPQCSEFRQGLFRFGNSKKSTPFAKIAVWKLVEFKKIVYLDPTTLVSKSLDFLFHKPGFPPSAPHAIFPADFFESSLMVIIPSKMVYLRMKRSLRRLGSMDCTETGFLNLFFHKWSTLPPQYRLSPHIYGVGFASEYPFRYNQKSGLFSLGKGPPLNALSYIPFTPQANLTANRTTWPFTRNPRLAFVLTKIQKEMSHYFHTMDPPPLVELPSHICIHDEDVQINLLDEWDANASQEQFIQPKIWPEASLSKQAYVTFIQNTNENFIQSAEVMIYSLRKHVDGRRDVVAMVTPFVDKVTRQRLHLAGFKLRDIDHLQHPLPEICGNSKWASVEDGNSEVAKLRVWQLEEYDKVVYLDADAVILDNIDELFERPSEDIVSASHGMFPPFEFNAGVMVLTPSGRVFNEMLVSFKELGTSDCGDQGFLNAYYNEWLSEASGLHRLPVKYNTHFRLFTLRPYVNDKRLFEWVKPKIFHFSGKSKPWEGSLVVAGVDWAHYWTSLLEEANIRRHERFTQERIKYIHSVKDSILATVAPFIGHKSAVLVDLSPEHSIRDFATYLGEQRLLRLLNVTVRYSCSSKLVYSEDGSFNDEPCDILSMENALETGDVILVHGNGFMFTSTADIQSLRQKLQLLEKLTQYRVIFLPQLMDPNLPPKFMTWIGEKVNLHPDVVFFWSDQRSTQAASQFFNHPISMYCPNTAFLVADMASTEHQQSQSPNVPEAVVIAPSSTFPEHRYPEIHYGELSPNLQHISHEDAAIYTIRELLMTLNGYQVAVTNDRTGAILSFLSMKPILFVTEQVEEFQDLFPSLSSFHPWTLPGVAMIKDWKQSPGLIHSLKQFV